MHKQTLILGLVVTLLLLFLFATKVLAGGQLVSLEADGDGWVSNDLYGRAVRVFLHPEYPCDDTEVTFRFVEPKDGDFVNAASTVLQIQPYYKNGVAGTTCSTYAKVGSKTSGDRQFTVDVKHGGVLWHTPPVITLHLDGKNYGGIAEDPYWIMTTDSWRNRNPTPGGTFAVWLLSQQTVAPYGRDVLIKWSALEAGATYTIFSKKNGKDWEKLIGGQRGPSATISLRADEDYSVKVQGCADKTGVCYDYQQLFLPKLQEQSNSVINDKSKTSNPSITVTPTNGSDKQVEQLNKKVSELEGKLAESQKRQNALEQAFNNLVSWLKAHIPFFR